MSDIRKEIEENRGAAKKLELLIPGLRGYRKFDDLKVADDLLRHQVADKLDLAIESLESLRKQMVSSGDFNNLTPVGGLISQIQGLSGKVRYAQQGYAPLVASIRIDDNKLNELYEYDYEFVSSAFNIADSASKITYDKGTIRSQIQSLSAAVEDFKRKWIVRMEAIEGIAQK